MTDIRSDEELLREIFSGSEIAFRQLIHKYQQALKDYVSVLLFSPDEVDDVVHETFIQFWKRYVQKNRSVESLKPLLFRIARNSSVDRIRKNTVAHMIGFDLKTIPHNHNPHQSLSSEELNRELEQFIFSLKAKDREILELFYLEQMKLGDIASVVGLGEEAVSSRLRRARERLRDLLPENFYKEWMDNHD